MGDSQHTLGKLVAQAFAPPLRHASEFLEARTGVKLGAGTVQPNTPPPESSTPAPPGPAGPPSAAVLLPEELQGLIGAGVAHLLTKGDWVHRRTDSIRFLDAATIRRQIGVDFTLPPHPACDYLYAVHPGLVPLGALRKQKLEHFGLWDESGRGLPMLETDANGYFATAALMSLARGAALAHDIPSSQVPAAFQAVLKDVAELPAVDAEKVAACVLHKDHGAFQATVDSLHDADFKAPLQELASRPDDLALVRRLLHGPDDDEKPDENNEQEKFVAWATQRAASRALRSLVSQLASDFIVLAQTPPHDYDPAARRIIKFDYEGSARARTQGWARVRRAGVTLLEVMSWWPSRMTLDTVTVGWTRSYHIEIEAPDGVDLLGAGISADDAASDGGPWHDETDEADQQRVHLQVSHAPRLATGPLWVELRADRRGFLQAAVVTSLFVAVVLLLWRHRLVDLLKDGTDPPTALLVAVPTLVSAYLLLPGEHRMASRMLRGPRLFLLGVLGCSAAAGIVLAGGYTAPSADPAWTVLGDAAIGFLGCLSLSYAMPYAAKPLRSLGGWLHRGWTHVRAAPANTEEVLQNLRCRVYSLTSDGTSRTPNYRCHP